MGRKVSLLVIWMVSGALQRGLRALKEKREVPRIES